MANLNHELFGEISYDLYWSGQQKIKIFGKEKAIILSMYGNEEGEFHDAQKEAYTNLAENMDDIMTRVEEAIFDYYQEVYMDYREMVGEDEADKIVPHYCK